MIPSFIGIAGRAGVGKSTLAKGLATSPELARKVLDYNARDLFGYQLLYPEIRSFADRLKAICRDVFGFSDDQLWGPSELRNQPVPYWDGLTPRKALQTLGTEWGRAMHPDVWVRYLIRGAKGSNRVIIVPDLRFDNEARALRAEGAFIVQIKADARVPNPGDAHASEAGIDPSLVDLVVHNDRDDGGAAMLAAVLATLKGWPGGA